MAIKQIVSDGIGFNDGQIGFLITQGFGTLEVAGPGGVGGLLNDRRRRAFVLIISLLLSCWMG